MVDRMAETGIMYGKDVEQLKHNFQRVLSELDSMEEGSQKEQEMFERMKELIDVKKIERLHQMLDAMQKKAQEAEERALEAYRDQEKCRKELDLEQERLEKLWDAYRQQEDDLADIQRKQEQWKQRCEQQENRLGELQKQVATLKELEADREKVEKLRAQLKDEREAKEAAHRELERVSAAKEALEKENDDLQKYIPYKKEAEQLRKRVQELEPLQDYVRYKEQAEELEKQYQREQERLAKLYRVYEDLEQDLESCREKVRRWERWFKDNREYVDKAAYAFSKFKAPEDLMEE
ncbi:MAG: hypothetical protein KGY55_04165 [Candidatus Thermoplasmatota archaeon]|nr:hypothetical protein [Candidatus Thermoplasmatota archaeon]